MSNISSEMDFYKENCLYIGNARKVLLKEIKTDKSLLFKETRNIEYLDVNSFKNFLSKNIITDLSSIVNIVSVQSSSDVLSIVDLSKKYSTPVYLKFNSCNEDTLSGLYDILNNPVPIVVPSNLVIDIKKIIDKVGTENEDTFSKLLFVYLSKTFGIFEDTVNKDNFSDIISVYTDPYFILPSFCISKINWDYLSLGNIKVSDIDVIEFNLNFLMENFRNRKCSYEWNLGQTSISKDYLYNYFYQNEKDIFVDNDYFYLKGKDFIESRVKIDSNLSELDDQSLNNIFSIYDLSYFSSYSPLFRQFINPYMNYKFYNTSVMNHPVARIIQTNIDSYFLENNDKEN